jgi:hypothetical protein
VGLRQRYAAEYASMLRVVRDCELAKEAARLNVSALALGQARIVPTERDWSAPQVREAIARGGEDLGEIRQAISRLSHGAGPAREPLRVPRVRDVGPER